MFWSMWIKIKISQFMWKLAKNRFRLTSVDKEDKLSQKRSRKMENRRFYESNETLIRV